MEHVCGKCGGAMEQGFALDATHGKVIRGRWLSGTPESSWWLGLKTSGHECRTIEMWRCLKCGFLESYAHEVVEPPDSFFQAE